MVDSVSMYSGLVTCEAVGKRLGKLLLFDRLLYWPHTAWEHWRTKPSLHCILTESTICSLWHSNDSTCTCTSSTCTNFSQQLQDEAKKQVSHSCIDWSSSHASQSHMIPYEAHVFVTICMIRTLHTEYTYCTIGNFREGFTFAFSASQDPIPTTEFSLSTCKVNKPRFNPTYMYLELSI